jgi:hypothetical protein
MDYDPSMPETTPEERAAFLRWHAAMQTADADLKLEAASALIETRRQRRQAMAAVKALGSRS